jgi:hypothetical protein
MIGAAQMGRRTDLAGAAGRPGVMTGAAGTRGSGARGPARRERLPAEARTRPPRKRGEQGRHR